MSSRDTQELLGSRGVPNLGTHRLLAVRQGYITEHILHSVGPLRLSFVHILADSQQKVGLANTFVPDDDHLVEIVERLLGVVQGVRKVSSRCIRIDSV